MAKKIKKNEAGIKPLGDKILVKVLEENKKEKKSESGIIIPGSGDKNESKKGEVIAIGEGKILENGEIVSLSVKEGDIILFKEFAGDEVNIKGVEYQILSESGVLGILE